jgi:DNA-binding protein
MIKEFVLSSTIDEKPLEKENRQHVFEINHESAMAKALDLISPFCENNQIVLSAKGDSIPNAITVANIITESLLKGKSTVYKVTVNSDQIKKMGSLQSTIKIILKK